MIEITAEIRAFIDKAAAGVELAEDEYQHTLKFASKSYFHNFFHLGIIQAGESYNVYLECNQNKTIVLDINSMELGVSDFRRHYKFVVKYQQPKQFLLVMHQLFL